MNFNLELTLKSILVLMAVGVALIIFGIVIGGYFILTVQTLSESNGEKLDRGYEQILKNQHDNNVRGNDTIRLFFAIINHVDRAVNQSLVNQGLILHAIDISNNQSNKTLANQIYFKSLHEFNARALANLTHTHAPVR